MPPLGHFLASGSHVIDRLLSYLPDFSSPQFWLWASVAIAAAGGLLIGGLLLMRRRAERDSGEDESPVSWEDFVASMHDRLDQCELLLKQFAHKADKQNHELQESVARLQGSMDALEKPFSAVSSRFSQIGQDGARPPR